VIYYQGGKDKDKYFRGGKRGEGKDTILSLIETD